MKHFILLSSLILFVFLSGNSIQQTTQTNQLVEFVWDYSQLNPNGFTLDIKTLKPVEQGIAVSYLATQNSVGKKSLKKVIEHALAHEMIVGGWRKDSIYMFDSSIVFPDSLLESALRFARENRQDAIYDLTNNKEIPVN